MKSWLGATLARRPMWMNVLLIFCIYMTFVFMPRDMFVKPVRVDEEAWFGLLLRGWAAKLTEPIHWAIYAAGMYGFWRMRRWMWPWAALYTAQVAIGMLVWSVVYVGGFRGWAGGLLGFMPIAALAVALWRARDAFGRRRGSLRQRYGEWALVTGASAGIGAEFARALARDGLSCVLVARREDRLKLLAEELERHHRVATRVVAIDLTQPGASNALADRVADLEIGLLVNNAGFGGSGRFDKVATTRLEEMVQLNCLVPVAVTRRLLPAMVTRRRGAVIIVGSVAGRQPLPLHSVYSATKAFDMLFGEALWAELQGSGVDALVLEPGATATEFQAVAGEVAHAGEPPQSVVEAALDALGHQPSVVSGWGNWLGANAIRLAPRSIAALMAKQVVAPWTPAEMR